MKSSIYYFICIFIYIAQVNAKVRIVTCEEPPTNYTLNDKFTGITTDIVEELKKTLNVDTKIEVMPWVRSYKIAKKYPNVVIFTAGRSLERVSHGFHFIGPVITRRHSLWSVKGSNYNINSIQDIKNQNLVIGAMREDWRGKYFKDRGLIVHDATDHKQNLKKLLHGRIKLWISSDFEAHPIARDIYVDIDKIKIAYVFKELPSYIMLSKDTPPETVTKWKNAYAELQRTNFFEKASKKWSNILGFDIGYTNNKGFYLK